MLHPNLFEFNEAWIVFRLNSTPIRTERDGDFNCIALMDAASCLILGSELIPLTAAAPRHAQFRRLLKSAQHHKQPLPKTLFVPNGDPADLMARGVAERSIDVVRVSDGELLPFIAEARQGFAEQFEESPRDVQQRVQPDAERPAAFRFHPRFALRRGLTRTLGVTSNSADPNRL